MIKSIRILAICRETELAKESNRSKVPLSLTMAIFSFFASKAVNPEGDLLRKDSKVVSAHPEFLEASESLAFSKFVFEPMKIRDARSVV